MKDFLIVGKILSPWGVKGQVKVEPLTDNIRRFNDLKSVFVEHRGELLPFDIESVLFLKNAFAVLKLRGINSREEAERVRGNYIKIHRKDAVKLPEDHYFIGDIIGLDVLSEDGKHLGIVTNVLKTGANDVYVVQTNEKKEILIPAIKEVIIGVDLEKNTMTVRLMEGMI